MLPDILAQTESKIVRIFRRPESVVIHLIQALFTRNLKVRCDEKSFYALDRCLLEVITAFRYLHEHFVRFGF